MARGEDAWEDAAGVVHYVGGHARGQDALTIYTDCREVIARLVGRHDGFYEGNTAAPVTCLLCLQYSNFGTYAP